MFPKIKSTIDQVSFETISEERKQVLAPLIQFTQSKVNNELTIRLNFICTHNSRRSHLSQVWAQTAAAYHNIENVFCYSGGTEATVLFPKVAETLVNTGFEVKIISEGDNPIYAIKYNTNDHPVIGFSKSYEDDFNPQSEFAAILTCSQADG